ALIAREPAERVTRQRPAFGVPLAPLCGPPSRLPGMLRTRTRRTRMSFAAAVLIVSKTAPGTTINPDRTEPTPDVPSSDRRTVRARQSSRFDRLIWGRRQERVIEG